MKVHLHDQHPTILGLFEPGAVDGYLAETEQLPE
jgi:hypothetical protein